MKIPICTHITPIFKILQNTTRVRINGRNHLDQLTIKKAIKRNIGHYSDYILVIDIILKCKIQAFFCNISPKFLTINIVRMKKKTL